MWTRNRPANLVTKCGPLSIFYQLEQTRCHAGTLVPNSKNDEDVVESALEEYREQYNSAFKYKHCLSELERIPKFDPKYYRG
jgi:hypothetical protein